MGICPWDGRLTLLGLVHSPAHAHSLAATAQPRCCHHLDVLSHVWTGGLILVYHWALIPRKVVLLRYLQCAVRSVVGWRGHTWTSPMTVHIVGAEFRDWECKESKGERERHPHAEREREGDAWGIWNPGHLLSCRWDRCQTARLFVQLERGTQWIPGNSRRNDFLIMWCVLGARVQQDPFPGLSIFLWLIVPWPSPKTLKTTSHEMHFKQLLCWMWNPFSERKHDIFFHLSTLSFCWKLKECDSVFPFIKYPSHLCIESENKRNWAY